MNIAPFITYYIYLTKAKFYKHASCKHNCKTTLHKSSLFLWLKQIRHLNTNKHDHYNIYKQLILSLILLSQKTELKKMF